MAAHSIPRQLRKRPRAIGYEIFVNAFSENRRRGALQRAHTAMRTNSANYLFCMRDDAVIGMNKSEHFACKFFDNIVLRQFWGQQGDITLQLGAHDLEAAIFELEEACALDEPVSNQEAVAAIDGVIGEVGGQTGTEKQHEQLPDGLTPIIHWLTQHCFLFCRYARRDPRTPRAYSPGLKAG